MLKLFGRFLGWLGNINTIQGLPEQSTTAWKWVRRAAVVLTALYVWFGGFRWEIQVPLALFVLAFGLVSVRLTLDFYAKWQRSRSKRSDGFTGNIDAIAIAQLSGRWVVLLMVNVVNRGPASVLQQWKLYYQPPGADLKEAARSQPNAEDTIVLESRDGRGVKLNTGDFLPAKTFPTPLQSGGSQRGFLMAFLPADPLPGTLFTVTYEDAWNNPYRCLPPSGGSPPLSVGRLGHWAGVEIKHGSAKALIAEGNTSTQKSLRAEWTREAEAFDALVIKDHYQRSPGEPMPGGISKVHAYRVGVEWHLGGGLDDHVRKDVEVQCHSAGNLLRHTQRSRHSALSDDDLQAWVQFVSDSGEVTTTYESTQMVDDREVKTKMPEIDVLTVASARACRRCAAKEPP